eukprot:GILI01006414.1.p1 GENE.GILI01006414.1~~GILI01006414.1.p1  ORF type:complete len:409 (+),score=77.86 GILI01006414.1:173-1228(+)
MECSGVHRGLGVHLSFVRSATIDDWTAWRPEKLRQMEIGGNRKARLFFERLGVPKQPIRARYENNGALMYKDKLEAEATGKPFNEASWQEPEWKQRMASNAATNKYQGMGSGGNTNASNGSGGGGGDWLGAISDGWGKVASATTEYAQATTKSLKEAGIQDKATESATWAWGSLASYATTIGKMAAEGTNSLVAATSTVVGGQGGGEEDGLGGLTRNVNRTETTDERFKGVEYRGAPAARDEDGLGALTRNVTRTTEDNERFKGVEHRAEVNNGNDGWGSDDGWGNPTNGLKSLAGNVAKSGKYEGIGSDAPSPNRPSAKISSPTPQSKPVESVSPSDKKSDPWEDDEEFE